MTITGAIMNGTFVPDLPLDFQNGTRFRLESEDLIDSEPTHEEHLAALRKSYEDAKAGKGRPFEVVMAELSAKYGLPPLPTE